MRETDTAPAIKKRENKALRSHPKKSEPSSTSLSHSTIQSGNRLSTTFKIYPEGDHFSAPPPLPPSFPPGVRRPPGWPPYSTPTLVYSPRSTWRDPPTLTSHHVLPSFTLLWPPQRHCLSLNEPGILQSEGLYPGCPSAKNSLRPYIHLANSFTSSTCWPKWAWPLYLKSQLSALTLPHPWYPSPPPTMFFPP